MLTKKRAVVGNAEAEFVAALEGLHVALAGTGEAVEGGENTQGGVAVDAAHVGLGRVCPDDPLPIGPL